MTAVEENVAPRWTRCPGCETLLYGKKLARNLHVCGECGGHHRLTAPQRVDTLVDADSFRPLGGEVRAADPLEFTDTRPYPVRLAQARATTGLDEAVLCGTAAIEGHRVVLVVMDFRFLGGSLGSAVGELITRAGETALRQRLPLVIVTASGGARMQEGALSLMQMAKTCQTIARLREAGLLTVSVVTDPTYGGVAASFATTCDVIVAENGARLGFAGPRVIEQTIRQRLPEGFQTAEFLLEHGQIDVVRQRRDLRPWLARLLEATAASSTVDDADVAVTIERDPARVDAADAWETVARSRHVDRPTALDYIGRVFESFVELRGDRTTGDCPAIVAGLARFEGRPVAVIGTQKGHTTAELVARNFGMPRPQGYRKARRVMELAARLGVPVITLVDTPGAYPGIDAEENGQALAVAESILAMTALPVPVVAVITGEGGSGGALALATANRVLMLRDAVYSVISPEGCSSILFGGATSAPEAARSLRITAGELLGLGLIDGVVAEPEGGASADHNAAADALRAALRESLAELAGMGAEELIEHRRDRFRVFGADQVTDSATSRKGQDRA